MAGKGEELLKYLTERVVTYMETPRGERKRQSQSREQWSSRWFGMIPMSLRIWAGRRNPTVDSVELSEEIEAAEKAPIGEEVDTGSDAVMSPGSQAGADLAAEISANRDA